MTELNPLLAFAAGAITILSPCVLPIVPIVFGSAAQQHRFGPLALAAGLVFSFTIAGFTIAAFGSSIGLANATLRPFGAALLLVIGVLLVSNAWNLAVTNRLATVAAPFTNWASSQQTRAAGAGLGGQAIIGALLGIVWSPCIGPTLGAATLLAAQGKDLAQVLIVMLFFALGIAASLLVLAFAVRYLLTQWLVQIMAGGFQSKRLLGVLLIVVAGLVMTGFDHNVEGLLIAASPHWLIDLTTSV